MNRGYEARKEIMFWYVKTSHDLIANFKVFEIIQIPREENDHVDALTNLWLASGIVMKKVIPFAYLDDSNIEPLKLKEVIKNVEEPSEDWRK